MIVTIVMALRFITETVGYIVIIAFLRIILLNHKKHQYEELDSSELTSLEIEKRIEFHLRMLQDLSKKYNRHIKIDYPEGN